MLDLILRNVRLPDGRGPLDLGIAQGRIAALEPALQGEAAQGSLRCRCNQSPGR